MSKSQIMSLIASLAIAAAGLGGVLYLKKNVPLQLTGGPLLAVASAASAPDSNGEKKADSLKDIIFQTQKKVVMIELDNGSLGSGFLYNKQGDVITNAHVVDGYKRVVIKTADARDMDGEVIGVSSDTDIAVVRVAGLADAEPLSMAKDRKAEIGDEVLALGSPLGLQNTVTTGIISGVDRSFTIEKFKYSHLYQISAPIAPGNSGGPLIDKKTGEVLGINSAAAREQGAIGFSIPIANIIGLAEGWSASPVKNIKGIDTAKNKPGAAKSSTDAKVDAEYVVKYFYDCISRQDYVTAYSLLGSSWQGKQTYDDFRKGYLNTRAVRIDSLSSLLNGDALTVSVGITAEERKSNTTVYTQYKLIYVTGYENDRMKIISGKGEAIK